MDEDRGSSFAAHCSPEDILEEAATDEYAGGASEYGDKEVLLSPARGGSAGRGREIVELVAESIATRISSDEV